jgi:phenylalanyl-tRNA synthetase beta chain
LNLKSEASSKFEKGIDPNGVKPALDKAVRILIAMSPNSRISEVSENRILEFPFHQVSLTREKLNQYGNYPFDRIEVEEILKSLGIAIKGFEDEQWQLEIPRFKEDVTREEDVIEEILRIYGYNNLPYPKNLRSSLSYSKGITRTQFEHKIANLLVGKGYAEVITNSISQSRYYPNKPYVKLLNSMTSELDSMRAEIIPSILEVIEYNLNRDNKDINIFEFGHHYSQKDGNYAQSKALVLAATGNKSIANWSAPKGIPNDYFQIKSIVENLLASFNVRFTYSELQDDTLHYGIGVTSDGKSLGYLGSYKIDKSVFDIKQPVFVAELNFDMLYEIYNAQKIVYQEVSKFPQVRRDLAIVIDEAVNFSRIEEICTATLKTNLTGISLFDIFKDKSIGEGKKSYAFRLILENREKTMQDSDIEAFMAKLTAVLRKELNADIRS